MNNLTDNIEYSLQQHYAAAQLLSSNNNNSSNQQQSTNQQQQDPNAFNLAYTPFPLIRMAPPQLHQATLARELTASPPPAPSTQHHHPHHQQQQQQQPQTIIPEQVQLNHTNNSNNTNTSNEGRAITTSPSTTQNNNPRETPIRVTRPPNAYLLFNKEMRKILKDQDPTMKVAEISKEVGSRWKNMPKEQKDQYVAQANKLKEEQRALHPNSMYIRRSRAELVKAGHFTKRSASQANLDQDQQSVATNSSPVSATASAAIATGTDFNQQQPPLKKKKAKRDKKNSNIPKHPLSAYMWYLTEVRPETMRSFPGSNVGQISKLCADRWNIMTEEARLPWKSKAQMDKERYAREMQIYALQNDHNLGRGTRQKYRTTGTSTTSIVGISNNSNVNIVNSSHHHQLSATATADYNSSNQQQQQHQALFYTTNGDHHHHHQLSTSTSPTSILRNNPSNNNPMTLNPNALLQNHHSSNPATATDQY